MSSSSRKASRIPEAALGKELPPVSNNAAGNSNVINGIKLSNEPDAQKIITVVANSGKSGETMDLSYTNYKVIGNGSFGVVFQAKLLETGEHAAIKKVLQDKRFKNRELQIMRLVSHPNVVALKAFFYSNGDKKDEVFLNLVLEYVPETVYRTSRNYTKMKQAMPMLYVKLLDPNTGVLKLCDFGSAKILVAGEPNVSYICSRYYRAPELIFGSTHYTVSIDVWSAGCVMAELMIGQPLFPGESGVDQLVEIIKILGTPTREQIKAMNPNYTEYKFPQIKACPWSKVFKSRTTTMECLDMVAKLLDYTPTERLTAIEAMAHPFFDELRQPSTKMQNGRDLPELFNFTAMELSIRPDLIKKLVPPHVEETLKAQGIDVDAFVPVPIVMADINAD